MIYFITAYAGNDDSKYQSFLKPSLPADVVSIAIGGEGSIAEKYNRGIYKYYEMNGRTDEDVICFVHDDVVVVDQFFKEKLDLFFNKNENTKDVSIAGVIGSLLIGEGAFWWEHMAYSKGRVVQYYRDPNRAPMVVSGVEATTVSQVLTVDGLAMFVPARHLTPKFFDESYGGYHFYDMDTCVEQAKKGKRVFVLDIILEHHSEGDNPSSPAFQAARKKFLDKHQFPQFPIKVKQKKVGENE